MERVSHTSISDLLHHHHLLLLWRLLPWLLRLLSLPLSLQRHLQWWLQRLLLWLCNSFHSQLLLLLLLP